MMGIIDTGSGKDGERERERGVEACLPLPSLSVLSLPGKASKVLST